MLEILLHLVEIQLLESLVSSEPCLDVAFPVPCGLRAPRSFGGLVGSLDQCPALLAFWQIDHGLATASISGKYMGTASSRRSKQNPFHHQQLDRHFSACAACRRLFRLVLLCYLRVGNIDWISSLGRFEPESSESECLRLLIRVFQSENLKNNQIRHAVAGTFVILVSVEPNIM